MATNLVSVTQRQKIQWSEPSLPAALEGPVRQAMTAPFAYLPILSDEEVKPIPALVECFEKGLQGCDEDEVERMVGTLATIFPPAKISDKEAVLRTATYVNLLSDIPLDCLSKGFRKVAQISRFFPTVAEIREQAEPFVQERRSKMWALKHLLQKHNDKWRPEVEDRCTPEEAREIIERFTKQFSA